MCVLMLFDVILYEGFHKWGYAQIIHFFPKKINIGEEWRIFDIL